MIVSGCSVAAVSDWILITPSLALPDPLRTGAYRLEIISAVLRGSGTVHSTKKYPSQQFLLGVNKVTCTFMRPIN